MIVFVYHHIYILDCTNFIIIGTYEIILSDIKCGICGDLEQLQPMKSAEVCTSTALRVPGMSVELVSCAEPNNTIGKYTL